MSKQLAIVKSWDTALGTGLLSREGVDDIEITRSMLATGDDLRVGDRVVFELTYDGYHDGEVRWSYGGVKAVSDDEAEVIKDELAVTELERLCSDVDHADSRMDVASELASDDDVDSARDDLVRAGETLRARVPQIGASLYERGGADAMHRVLGQVDQRYRATIAGGWRGIGTWES
jgi:hypothetical protein